MPPLTSNFLAQQGNIYKDSQTGHVSAGFRLLHTSHPHTHLEHRAFATFRTFIHISQPRHVLPNTSRDLLP